VPFLLADLCRQPRRQPLGIGHAALSEPQVLADLGAMELDRAARPFVELDFRGRDLDLGRHEAHHLVREIRATAGEAAVPGVELQQQSEARLRRSALAGDHLPLVVQQCPMLDQLIQIDRTAPMGAYPRPASPIRHVEIDATWGW
jgi:hypothetical protein